MRPAIQATWLALIVANHAHAQLRLPALPLPSVPLAGVTQSLQHAADQGETRLRRETVERLLRANRKTLEADPAGEAAVRGTVLAIDVTAEALQAATARGFTVLRERHIAAADLSVWVLQAPGAMSTAMALRALHAADPTGTYEYDHIYLGAGSVGGDTGDAAPPAPVPPNVPVPAPLPRIGLIDSGVEARHPVFSRSRVHPWGCEGTTSPDPHGTAVASVLVASRAAEIYAADVYCGHSDGGAVETIATALGWLLEQRIAVINVSLVGPKNALLEHVVRAAIGRGFLLIAAVGNDGPASPPLYPAAYPGVLGITAVDVHHRVLLEAVRGPQVTFAALGADISAAQGVHDTALVRGTSFAAPTVAAMAAALLTEPSASKARETVDALIARAIDLGTAGRDLTYGYGFLDRWEETAGAPRIPR